MFTAALFVIAKSGKNPNVHHLMNEQNVSYPYNGIIIGHKKITKYWHLLQHDEP